MPRSLALALLVAAVPLAGCGEVAAPPGDLIGTFQFVADLDATVQDGRCGFADTPGSMKFEAVLSYEPTPLEDGSRKLWVQILGRPGKPREGRLTGTRFIVRSPVDPDRVPRTLDACRFDDDRDGVPDKTRCTLGFAEFIGGDLLAHVPAPAVGGCTAEGLKTCGAECVLKAGWDADPARVRETVGGVCGDVTEDVVPEPSDTACLCTGDAGAVAPAATCTIVYRLEGKPS